MPGTRRNCAKFDASPPLAACRPLYQASESLTEKIGSLTPWYTSILAPRFFSVSRLVGFGGAMKLMADSVYMLVVALTWATSVSMFAVWKNVVPLKPVGFSG